MTMGATYFLFNLKTIVVGYQPMHLLKVPMTLNLYLLHVPSTTSFSLPLIPLSLFVQQLQPQSSFLLPPLQLSLPFRLLAAPLPVPLLLLYKAPSLISSFPFCNQSPLSHFHYPFKHSSLPYFPSSLPQSKFIPHPSQLSLVNQPSHYSTHLPRLPFVNQSQCPCRHQHAFIN